MGVSWNILYRGPLASCNYGCGYCPFAKRVDSPAALADDARKLRRFVAWALQPRGVELGVLFTPWGEALVHRAYRDAMLELSHAPQVRRVAAQTNLSGPLDWLRDADRTRLALWATWHPSEISAQRFLARCVQLDAIGVRYSVGAVGLRENLPAIEALRAALRPDVYLWVNAYKDRPRYYDGATVARFTAIDPLFPINLRNHPSRGQSCRAGETSFAVDGDGVMTRCHFVEAPIGNLYAPDFAEALQPRRCPRAQCRCHIGYVNLPSLGLDEVFRDGLLERVAHAEAIERLVSTRALAFSPQPSVVHPSCSAG